LSSSFQGKSGIFPIAAAIVIIIIAVAVIAAVQGTPDKAFSKVIIVGPIWDTNTWTCISDNSFVVHGALRGIGDTPQIQISVQGSGTQSFYDLNVGELESFSVGNIGGMVITITRTGTVTGFITLQTTSDAIASCTAT